jgi:exopolyphosphatase/guanosine-5'-triphosphate,3'-diphosphate pyrophosphatase
MRVAAIDIGTNSIRLLVAEAMQGDQRLKPLVRQGEACRLGQGLAESGSIGEEMLERACRVVGEMAELARRHGVRRLVVAATEAIRVSSNREGVLARLGAAAGVPVRVLSGQEEAELVYGAVAESMGRPGEHGSLVVFDIGGGSTEVVSGVGNTAGRAVSLPVGAVTLSERLLLGDPPSRLELTAVDDVVKQILILNCALFPKRPPVMAGVGGTVTILASMHLGLEQYDPGRIDGTVIPAAAVEEMTARLSRMSRRERLAVPVMGEGRADIVVAGARIALGLVRFFEASALMASSQGLRYALARMAALGDASPPSS